MLLEQLPEYLDSAQQQFADKNWKMLWDILHKLQGASSVCGVPALSNAVRNLQKLIEKENYHAFDSALDQLNREAKRLLAYAEEDA